MPYFTFDLTSVPPGFFQGRQAPYDKKGEQLCTTQVKGTTPDRRRESNTRLLCKGPENKEGGNKSALQ